ncbi:trigger factor [Stella humosa]|uniref:Trigger factor n=1 Tax=Stella humosa TaxID=94 RepID=A0A3N1ML19_9PROT|nr:trigger factor [Stella humosa]ROQ01696.1 trigger factor [Stella humosa]BBK32077.1 trigger factor [Stella humosa]
MNVVETASQGLKREFKVTVPAAELSGKVETRLTEIAKTANMPGFRPGKVPLPVLRRRYGQALLGEVLQETLESGVQQAMEERGLRPALQPKVEIQSFNEGADLEYTMAVEVLPQIAQPDFSVIELERLKAQVDEAEVDRALQRVADQHKRSVAVAEPRPVQAGDIAVIDFEGFVDGTAFAGGKAEDFHLEVGSGMFIPGFEDQIVGKEAGQPFDVEVTFPADYGNKQLAGKPARFAVTIKELKTPAPAQVDDELATQIGFPSLVELREAARQEMEKDFSAVTRARMKRELLDKLSANNDFEVPQGMVELEFEGIWSRVEEQRKAAAAPAQDGEAPAEGEAPAAAPAVEPDPDAGKDDETLKAEYRAIAERRVRLGLLLAEVGRLNNISVAQEEINRAISEEARRYPGQERRVIEFYEKNPQAVASLRAPLFEDKVVDHIVEQAKVSERAVPVEELLRDPDDQAADSPAAS